MSDFKELVADAVRAKGSQQKLAEACGVSQQQISYLLTGAKEISAEMAIKIDTATGGSIPRKRLRPDIFGSAA